MTPEERDLIAGLFQRLREADGAPKDREAEEFIRRQTAELPSAPYLMAQTVLVQEHALQNAQARIAELERQIAEARQPPAQQQGGSFLGGLIGGGPWGRRGDAASPPPRGWSQTAPAGSVPQAGYAPPAYGASAPYPTTAAMPASAGGGFLRSALTTAAGVAGGALLFQGIEGLLGHHAGAFGPALGGGYGGAGLGPTVVEENVTNNYYGSGGGVQQANYAPDQGGIQEASDFQPDDGGDGGSADDGGGDWV